MSAESPSGEPDSLEARVSDVETQFEALSTRIRQVWVILAAGLLIVIAQSLTPRLKALIVIPVAYYLLYVLFRYITDHVDL